MGGGLGDSQNQRVAGAGKQVACISARDGGESGGQTGQRMAARGGEDDGGQRNDDDVGSVRGVVRHHARHHHDRRQDESRGVQQGAANGGREHAGPLGDRGAVNNCDHDAERREIGQGAGHADEEPLKIGRRQQALGLQHVPRHRIDRRPAQAGPDQTERDQAQDQPQKQKNRIGQAVADALDGVQQTGCEAHAATLITGRWESRHLRVSTVWLATARPAAKRARACEPFSTKNLCRHGFEPRRGWV
ncbi:hypothetical protein D3C71_1388860 [compost metagenome]